MRAPRAAPPQLQVVAGELHARLLPAAVVVSALSAAVRGLGACRPGGGGVSGSWVDLAAACGRDSGLARLRTGSAMGSAREGGWTGGGVWRAGRAGHAVEIRTSSSCAYPFNDILRAFRVDAVRRN